MANQFSLSRAQTVALASWLELTLPVSLDDLAEKVGADDAFRLTKLRERLKDSVKS